MWHMQKQKPERVLCCWLVLGLLSACQPEPEGVSFSSQVLPLLNRHCVVCHMEQGAQGDFSLYPSPYQKLVGVKSAQSPLALIEPGSPEASYVYHKMTGTQLTVKGSGDSMPFERDLLAAAELDLVHQWITQGARDN
jgi:hypothetical protein